MFSKGTKDKTRFLVGAEKITVSDGRIEYKSPDLWKKKELREQSVSLVGAHARVETAGEIEKRVTATRILALGIFSLAAKKKSDQRELYLTIEALDGDLVVELNPKHGKKAREVAAQINTMAMAS